MTARTALVLMVTGYVAAFVGNPILHNRPLSIFGLLLIIVTGTALIKQSEVK